jgi:hypothetical protein
LNFSGYNLNGQDKEDEMRSAYSKRGRDWQSIQSFGRKAEGKDRQEDLRICGSTLKRETEWDGIEWFNLAQNGDQYNALVKMDLKFVLHTSWEILE